MSVNPRTDPQGAAEFAAAKQAARHGRRAFAQDAVSRFVSLMRHAITLYLKAREDGVSREDGIKGLEEELRAAWPKSVSKFRPACDACEDTGWVERTCAEPLRCGREVCAKNPEREHGYVEACHCGRGERFRPQQRSEADALTAVGKTPRKTRSWRQVGR